MHRRATLLISTLLLLDASAAAEGQEAAESTRYPSWDWGGSVGVMGGYDDNISVSSLIRPGEKQGSATTDISARIGPELTISELFSTSLKYSFDQSLYYSNPDLDEQSHRLMLDATLWHSRVEATVGYAFGVTALIPKGSLYSLDHQPLLSVEVLLARPLWVGLDYRFNYYDVRDQSYDYLRGQRHTVELYPEIYLARRLILYAGYRLELVRIGATQEEIVGPMGNTLQVTSPQSFDGHHAFLYVKWRPVARLALTLSGKLGRRLYTDPLTTTGTTGGTAAGNGPGGGGGGAGPRPGGGLLERRDTILTVEPRVSWNFWKGLFLQATFFYERSSSSVSTRRVVSSSYDNLAGSGGLRWEF